MALGKIKITFYFRNGSVITKVIEVTEDNLEGTMSLLEATKAGFRGDRAFVLSAETIIVRGSDLMAVDWQEVEEN